MTMFNHRPGHGLGLAIEYFMVPSDLVTARALFREMSWRVQRPLGGGENFPALTLADRFELAECFERYAFADEDLSLRRARWLALEKGIRGAGYAYVGWADLAREIATEEVFLRTGAAQAALAVLDESPDRFENVDSVLSVVSRVIGLTLSQSHDLRGQSSSSLNTGGLEASLSDGAAISRGGNKFDHSESSGGCVATPTVGDSGRVGNDPAAETPGLSGSGFEA